MSTENFGSKLKEIMNERGISIRKCSRETGIDKGTISRIINGERKANIQHLNKFSIALEVSLTELLHAADYVTDPVESPGSSELQSSIDGIQKTLKESNYYDENVSIDEVHQKLTQYENYADTEEGQRTIHNQFNKKLDKAGYGGPFIDQLKDFYHHFEEGKKPGYKLALMGSALLYFIVPVDVIPDYIFPIGYLDDAVAVKIVLKGLSL